MTDDESKLLLIESKFKYNKLFREYRLSTGFSQRLFAEKHNLSVKTVRNWEQNRTKIRPFFVKYFNLHKLQGEIHE